MGDGEPHALGRKGEPADGGGHFEAPRRALARTHEGLLAGGPGDVGGRADAGARARHDRSSAAWQSAATTSWVRSPLVATTLPSSPPVRMRSPSLAAARMPPPCTATRSGSPSRGTNRSASSPRTNTGTSPRKCAATTGAPAAIGRARSATEAIRSGAAIGSGLPGGYAAHSSKPLRIMVSGSSRPMNTIRLSRFSASFHSRWWSPSSIMWTPWNTNRCGSSLKARMPFERRILGPSWATRFWIQGKNLSGSIALSVEIDSDCMSSS